MGEEDEAEWFALQDQRPVGPLRLLLLCSSTDMTPQGSPGLFWERNVPQKQSLLHPQPTREDMDDTNPTSQTN